MTLDKDGKSTPPSWFAVTRTLSTSQSFQTVSKHNDDNTATLHKIKNNVLPKTEPCDTPQTISNGFDSASQIFDILMHLVQLTSRP